MSALHGRQLPQHPTMQPTPTTSPARNLVTSDPTSTTSPTTSWLCNNRGEVVFKFVTTQQQETMTSSQTFLLHYTTINNMKLLLKIQNKRKKIWFQNQTFTPVLTHLHKITNKQVCKMDSEFWFSHEMKWTPPHQTQTYPKFNQSIFNSGSNEGSLLTQSHTLWYQNSSHSHNKTQ